jgi:hypothetical protein
VHRVSDGIIWAGTAAVAFGAVVASLLYGSEPPWLVVAIVVLAGVAITTVRKRRRRAAWARAALPAPTVERRPPRPERKPPPDASPPRVEPRTPPATTTATGIPLGPEARRAGARGASLSDRPVIDPKPKE